MKLSLMKKDYLERIKWGKGKKGNLLETRLCKLNLIRLSCLLLLKRDGGWRKKEKMG